MDTDTRLARLLEATGPDPGWGDMDDVRRRARRLTRRRRLGTATCVVALLALGLVVARGLPIGEPRSAGVAAESADEAAGVGEVLFERELASGGTLRVRSTETPDEIAVELPGATQPLLLTPKFERGDEAVKPNLRSGGGPSPGPPPSGPLTESDVRPMTTITSYTEEYDVQLGGETWALVTLAVCPGERDVTGLRILTYYSSRMRMPVFDVPPADVLEGEIDLMELVDGLAIAAIPLPSDPALQADLRLQVKMITPAGISPGGSDGPAVSPPPQGSPPADDGADSSTGTRLRCEAGR